MVCRSVGSDRRDRPAVVAARRWLELEAVAVARRAGGHPGRGGPVGPDLRERHGTPAPGRAGTALHSRGPNRNNGFPALHARTAGVQRGEPRRHAHTARLREPPLGRWPPRGGGDEPSAQPEGREAVPVIVRHRRAGQRAAGALRPLGQAAHLCRLRAAVAGHGGGTDGAQRQSAPHVARPAPVGGSGPAVVRRGGRMGHGGTACLAAGRGGGRGQAARGLRRPHLSAADGGTRFLPQAVGTAVVRRVHG